MTYSNIYKNLKACSGIKKENRKKHSFTFHTVLFLLILFISSGLFFSFCSQNKLYAEESKDYGYYKTGVESLSKTPFIIPLDGEIVLGFRKDYFYNEKDITRKHTGIDIKGEFNQNVFSSGNGIVSYIGFSPTGGRTIVIRHNEKIRTTYLNLLNIFVSCGDYVQQGDVIGTIGGNDDPSSLVENHLHFGIIYNGFYLDPEDVLIISYKNITSYISLEYMENDFYLK
jgi:murein DD-endopeptidase MepM/ murein hydrolase activator NlpD